MEKVQWNSIDKQNGLKYSKNDKSSTLPRYNIYNLLVFYEMKKLQWNSVKKQNELEQSNMKNQPPFSKRGAHPATVPLGNKD